MTDKIKKVADGLAVTAAVKPFWQRKTTYVGLLLIGSGVVKLVFDHDYNGGMQNIMEGLGVLAIRSSLAGTGA